MGSTPTTHPITKPLATQGVFHFSFDRQSLFRAWFKQNCMPTHTKVYPIIHRMQNANAKQITKILRNTPASDPRRRSYETA